MKRFAITVVKPQDGDVIISTANAVTVRIAGPGPRAVGQQRVRAPDVALSDTSKYPTRYAVRRRRKNTNKVILPASSIQVPGSGTFAGSA
jgi:hypothetical protein